MDKQLIQAWDENNLKLKEYFRKTPQKEYMDKE